MPYIPQFNRLSLQEIAYAPALMREQHDEAVAKQMELAEALKFDYLQQDAPGIEPILQKYSTDIEKVSKDLATSGFSHDLKNKILGLRSKYVGDEKIRKYKKNYADAMSGWEELKKRKIQEGVPSQFLDKAKKAYFGAYQGAFDNDNIYSEFTPGFVSNYYDVAEDAKKAMTNIGKTGSIVGSSGSSVQLVNDPKLGTYYKVYDATSGQYITTKDQIEATKQYLKAEYSPENKVSDRGLFSKISGYTKEDVGNLIDQVGASMTEGYYQSLPQSRANFVGLGESEKKGQTQPLPTTKDLEVDSRLQKSLDKDLETINKPRPSQEGVASMEQHLKTIKDPRAAGYIDQLKRAQGNVVSEWERNRSNVIKKYKSLGYDELFSGNISEEDAVKAAIELEKNRVATVSTRHHIVADKKEFGGVQPTEGMMKFIFPSKENKVTIDKDGDLKTKDDFINLWEGKDDWKESIPSISRTGEIELTGPKGEKYPLNDAALSENTLKLKKKVLEPTLNLLNSVKISDNYRDNFTLIPEESRAIYVIQNPQDKYNISNRNVVEADLMLDNNGNLILDENNRPIPVPETARYMTTGDAMQYLVKGIFSGFNPVTFD